jgi:hypothetical protein
MSSDILPGIKHAMREQAVFAENLPLTVFRKGQDEQVWFATSHSPVLDENGQIKGMLCVVTKTTEKVLAQSHSADQTAGGSALSSTQILLLRRPRITQLFRRAPARGATDCVSRCLRHDAVI